MATVTKVRVKNSDLKEILHQKSSVDGGEGQRTDKTGGRKTVRKLKVDTSRGVALPGGLKK